MAKFNESEKEIQSLNEEFEKLRKQTKSVADENIRLNETIKKQSTSVDDLKDKDKQLTIAEKELEKLNNIINEASLKISESLNKKPKELTYKQTLRVFKAIPIEEWSKI
jgi:predicted nuclease with TOPRIM domain